MEVCTHPNLYDGVCGDCGMEVFATASSGNYIDMNSSFSEYHSYLESNSAQPFETDLKALNIPEEVKTLVINLASSCPRETHRMGVRRQQLFSYIYLAYLQLGFKFDPEKIRQDMKMTQREVNMSLRIISGTSSVDIPLPMSADSEPISAPIVVISPIIYLEEVCYNNGIKEHTQEVIKMSKAAIEKNKLLLEFNPKHMAISLVKHYLTSIDVYIPKFAKINGISDSILKQNLIRINK